MARPYKGATDPNSSDFNLNTMTDPGHTHQLGVIGSATGAAAAVTAPSFSTGTALQVNATQDVMLYIAVDTAVSLAIAFGPTSGASYTLVAAESVALSVISFRVPSGWYVKITGTISDLNINAVTC
jgi:hypothetical protein